MYGNLYESGRNFDLLSNYIYCSICDSLVFISENGHSDDSYRDNHLKRCIVNKANLIEYVKRKKILQAIDRRKFQI